MQQSEWCSVSSAIEAFNLYKQLSESHALIVTRQNFIVADRPHAPSPVGKAGTGP
jgi:hypothetical protein